MKNAWVTIWFASIALLLSPVKGDDGFEVHEWGTFTTFHTPNGMPHEWFQALQHNEHLPAFVKTTGFPKNGIYMMRMETPVIYFYTDQPKKVEVKASMIQGGVSEVFPEPKYRINLQKTHHCAVKVGSQHRVLYRLNRPAQQVWKVQLTPPDPDQPAILLEDENDPNNHYFAARAVPEAAIVSSKSKTGNQQEKFIFYRGLSDNFLSAPVAVHENGVIEVRRYHRDWPIWIVDNRSEQLTWLRLSEKGVVELDSFPIHPDNEAAKQSLGKSIHQELVSAGLTEAESSAMIATWKTYWFEEKGLRTFSIMKRKRVDEIVPLDISPAPSSLTRVFVHRSELIAPETLAAVKLAISDDDLDRKERLKILNQQELGRFLRPAIAMAAEQIGDEKHKIGLGLLK